MKKVILIISIFLLSIIFNSSAFCQTQNPLMEEGIKQYQNENYEEAIDALEQVRAQDPKSSLAAFFLGMAYKQTMDYDKAAVNLESALKLKPAVKEALVEYVNVLFQLGKISEAKEWIKVAKQQNIDPANIAFLEGMILSREKDYQAAIESFEKAKSLNKNLTQTADYQIGLCYVNARKFKNAQERFKAIATYDPKSDLAAYARQYLDAVENTLFYTRPIRVTLGLTGGYDSNVVSKPRQESIAGGTGDPGGGVISPSLRIEYVPQLDGPWLFNAMYSSSANFNEHYVHTRDSIANTFSMIPGYNFGRFSVSMLGSYTDYLLRTDSDIVPDGNAGYKHYQDYFTGGPIVKVMLTEKQILEVFGGYDKKNYYNQVITSENSMRDSEGFRAYLSWTWFFWNNGFVNLRYDAAKENTNGSYWDNTSNRFSGSLVLPVLPDDLTQKTGFIYLQLAGSFTAQDYSFPQPYSAADGSSKSGRREDSIYNGSASINWDITKNWTCILQYSYTKSDSNIPVYEYTRNLYTAGIEFKF
ncbi:MAG: tetratricopeptide repeat protein [Smithellaceae bacterium]